MIEIYLLEQLDAFARHGTLSAAAQALHTSQPSMTRAMQKLEDELGVELFDRVGRNIRLNAYGQIYARRKDWKKAVFYIKKTLALEPDYPRIHFTLGHLYREMAEEGNNSYWEKALKHLDQAVLRDNTVECHMERGDACYNKGDYASACEDFRWILAREPENQPYGYGYGPHDCVQRVDCDQKRPAL